MIFANRDDEPPHMNVVWWDGDARAHEYLTDATSSFDHAAVSEQAGDVGPASEYLLGAIETLAEAYLAHRSENGDFDQVDYRLRPSDYRQRRSKVWDANTARAFREFLSKVPSDEDAISLCSSTGFSLIRNLTPLIKDEGLSVDDTGEKLPPSDEKHRAFNASFDIARRAKTGVDSRKALSSVGFLLYTIRSNIAHNKKRFGRFGNIDLRERDEKVCESINPFLKRLVEVVLDHPENRLLAYDSLLPGGCNHNIIASARGTWSDVNVRGKIESHGEYSAFHLEHRGDEKVSVSKFESTTLPLYWARLDDSEKPKYGRFLVPFETSDSRVRIAYIYAGMSANVS